MDCSKDFFTSVFINPAETLILPHDDPYSILRLSLLLELLYTLGKAVTYIVLCFTLLLHDSRTSFSMYITNIVALVYVQYLSSDIIARRKIS